MRGSIIVGRTVLAPCALLLSGQAAHAQTERFYALTVEGKRAGYSRFISRKTAAGLETTGETVIKVSLLGAPFDMSYQAVTLRSADGKRLLRYALTFRRGPETTTVECRTSGAEVHVAATVGGKTTRQTFPYAADTFLVEGNSMDTWDAMFRAMGPRVPGKVKLLAPLSASIEPTAFALAGQTTVTVQGRKRVCDRIRTGEGLSEVELVVDKATRELIELRAGAQKAVFRLSDVSATRNLSTFDPGSRMFSLVDEPMPDAGDLTYLKARVRVEVAGEKPTVASLQSPTQKFTGTAKNGLVTGVFEIRPYRYDGKQSPAFTGAAPSDPKLAAYLKAEHYVESNDPEIKALARQITDGATTTWDAVERIGRWIKGNISYAITGSGARECLRTKKGDCGPHSWLTIALCRAVGIPARITGGVLYSRALAGSFGQHYWVRVWMGRDGWVPIDTTTREVGTLSPAHITLWNLGGVGSLSVKVLAYEPKVKAPAATPLTARRPYTPAVGDAEKWVFLESGNEIGEQTADCVRVSEEGGRTYSDWKYSFAVRPNPPAQAASMSGTFSVWSDGEPRSLVFSADAGGAKQTGSYGFKGGSVAVDMHVAGQEIKRSFPVQPGELLQMNNILTLFSVASRVLGVEVGATLKAPFFAAGALQSVEMTFKAEAEPRTIEVMGKSIACVVYEVEPIKNRFFAARDTGELLRVEIDAAKLVIERR